MSLLTVRDLSVTLGGRRVLNGVTFGIAAGECIGLIGPNAAGKSTAMRVALGLIPAEGESSLRRLSPPQRARAAAWLPQSREIAWDVWTPAKQRAPPARTEPWCGPGARGWLRAFDRSPDPDSVDLVEDADPAEIGH